MTIAALRGLCSRVPWCEPAVLESSLELALEQSRLDDYNVGEIVRLTVLREKQRVDVPVRLQAAAQ